MTNEAVTPVRVRERLRWPLNGIGRWLGSIRPQRQHLSTARLAARRGPGGLEIRKHRTRLERGSELVERLKRAVEGIGHLRLGDRRPKLLGEGITPEEAMVKLNGLKLTVGKKVVHLSRNNPDRVWRFEKPEGYGDVETSRPPDKDLNVNRIQHLPNLLNAILTLEVPSADDFLKGPPDLTTLGLDPTNQELLRIDLH